MLIQRKAEAGFYNLNRTDLTFEALAVAWLHSLQNSIKESTYAYYSYTLHKYLLPVLSKVPVASLEESFLEQAMQQIIAPTDAVHKPLGNSSARECLSMLRRICKYAAHLRLIRPMELEVALPKAIDKISAPLSPAEQQRLHQYVQANPTPRKIGLLLGLKLGLRIGEICGLQWGVFDLKLGTLNINRTVCRISCGNGHTKVVIQTPKTRTSRREIPLPKQLLIMPKSCAEAPEMLHGSFPAASPSPPNPAATGKASKEITLISPLLKWKIPLFSIPLFFAEEYTTALFYAKRPLPTQRQRSDFFIVWGDKTTFRFHRMRTAFQIFNYPRSPVTIRPE